MRSQLYRSHSGFDILQLPVLRDNFIYLLLPDGVQSAWVVDPADSAAVVQACNKYGRNPSHIFNTHHHWDHTDGNNALVSRFHCDVLAMAGGKAPCLTHGLHHGDNKQLNGLNIQVIAVPGHTDDHLAFVVDDALFCGDALFSAGCGRIFEGTATQMHHSLQLLAALPASTRVYCAHEYTGINLEFALHLASSLGKEGEDYRQHCQKRKCEVIQLSQQDTPSVPSTMAEEHQSNPFLQTMNATFNQLYSSQHGTANTALAVFSHMRNWRNDFVA